MSDKEQGICSVCDGKQDAMLMMEMDGEPICFPCAIAMSWLDMRVQQEMNYDDAVEQQQQEKVERDLFAEVGLKTTSEGNLYYPDEKYDNVLHIAQARMVMD
jgi:hypothetical protein